VDIDLIPDFGPDGDGMDVITSAGAGQYTNTGGRVAIGPR